MEEQRKSENALVPALRFEGFSDPWEQRKLGEICEGLSYGVGAAAVPFDGATRYLRITDIDDETHQFLEDDLSSPDPSFSLSDTDYLRPGEIVFARTGASVGKTYLNRDDAGDIVFAGFLIRAVLQEGNNPEFVYQQTLSESYKNYVAITSQRSGQPGVNAQEYSEWILWICDKDEQARIGALFQKFDLLIALHQRKHEKLKTVKQSLLEKMFPKEGEDVPEIRFEGFTDPWEQRKVGDYLVESRERGSSGDVAKKLTVKLWGKGVTEKAEISGSAHTQYYVRHAGQFIYSKLDFLNAAFGVIPDNLDEYESTADLPAFDVSNLDARFLLLKATQRSFYLRYGTIADGSRKAKRIHSEAFLAMPLFVPDYIEQTRIANLFARLDLLIALHQRELDILKNLKQALLEKMFV